MLLKAFVELFVFVVVALDAVVVVVVVVRLYGLLSVSVSSL